MKFLTQGGGEADLYLKTNELYSQRGGYIMPSSFSVHAVNDEKEENYKFKLDAVYIFCKFEDIGKKENYKYIKATLEVNILPEEIESDSFKKSTAKVYISNQLFDTLEEAKDCDLLTNTR